MTTKTRIGSNFDAFLREEGIYDQTQAVALERMLAYELEGNMQRARLTTTNIAERTGTTRARLSSERWRGRRRRKRPG